MIDMTRHIVSKSDQLNSADLGPEKRVIRIVRVTESGNDDQPILIHYEGGDGRPYKPCKSMRRALVFIWGMDASQYVGRALEVYNDPDVTWGGEKVGGIRISRASHIDGPVTFPLNATKTKRTLWTVEPLPADRPRKTLAEHVDGYVAAIEGAETLEALAAVQQSEGAQKVRTAASKPGNEAQLARMNDAGSKRYAELSPPTEEAGDGIDGMFADQSGKNDFGDD